MECDVGILNTSYEPEEELVIVQADGDNRWLDEDVKGILFDNGYSTEDLDNGDWITIVDGEVVSTGHLHPFKVKVRE